MHQDWEWITNPDTGKRVGIGYRGNPDRALSLQHLLELRDIMAWEWKPWPGFAGPIGAECSKEMQAVIDKYQPLYDEQVRQDVERIKNGNSD